MNADLERQPVRAWLHARRRWLYPAVFLVVVIAGCQAATVAFKIPPYILPSPRAVWEEFATTNLQLWKHMLTTVVEAVSGFSLAVVIGITLAVLITRSEIAELTIYPYLVALSTIPILAVAPLLILWFGFGMLPKIIVSALIAFLPIVINTIRGLRAVDYRVLELMYSLSATDWQVYRKIRFFTALPYIFSALKVSIAGAVVGAVVGEFLGSDVGMGYMIIRASSRLDAPLLFTAIVLLAVLGVSLFLVISLIERRLLHWYEGATIL